jgi:hypothetical protein
MHVAAAEADKSGSTFDKVMAALAVKYSQLKAHMHAAVRQVQNKFGVDTDDSDFRIGHIMHLVQDSFANGHALRDRVGADKCGRIVLFQGYGMQAGNSWHGDVDHNPGGKFDVKAGSVNLERRKELYACARKHSSTLLGHWAACKVEVFNYLKQSGGKDWKGANSVLDVFKIVAAGQATNPAYARIVSQCRFPVKWFDQVFQLAPGVDTEMCGGATARSSTFYDPDPALMRKKAAQAKMPVMERELELKYTDDNGKGTPFNDCSTTTGAKPGHCKITIFQPKYTLGAAVRPVITQANRNGKPVTAIGPKDAPLGIDFDEVTNKDAICENQMKQRDNVFWAAQAAKRNEWQQIFKPQL